MFSSTINRPESAIDWVRKLWNTKLAYLGLNWNRRNESLNLTNSVETTKAKIPERKSTIEKGNRKIT